MSKLQELIQRLCPDGVEYKTIEQIGSFYGGLTGKSKEDFAEGNAKFITYLNIYTNPSLSLDIKDTVRVEFGEKQNIVKYGDILFTGSSETPDECGMSSVLTQYTNEPLYLNSFCFGLRLEAVSDFNLDFLKHLFRSVEVRKQIAKTANGVTRFNISKKLFAKIKIPVPPLEVQEEIVKILDRFAVYAAELQAELQARKEQYEYYRNLLLTFNPTGCAGGADDEQEGSVTTWGGHSYPIHWKTMGEIAIIPKSRIATNIISCYVGVETLLQDRKGVGDYTKMPSSTDCIEFKQNDVLIGNIRPYLRKIWQANCSGGTNGDVLLLRVKDQYQGIHPRYFYHLLANDKFSNYHNQYAKGAKMPRGDKEKTLAYVVPVPPLELQEKIVAVLDRFETLVNDLSEGLPAEIAAVKEQYEYYRNRLLTFKEKTA